MGYMEAKTMENGDFNQKINYKKPGKWHSKFYFLRLILLYDDTLHILEKKCEEGQCFFLLVFSTIRLHERVLASFSNGQYFNLRIG